MINKKHNLKAKVIETGEIIECYLIDYNVDGSFYLDENTDKEYHGGELEFIPAVDFDKELKKWRCKRVKRGVSYDYEVTRQYIEETAKHFFELGKKYAWSVD